MKVSTEELGNRQVSLTIEVDPERVGEALRRAARKLADRGKIPGYRKGKAPFQAVKRRYGEDALYEEAADDLAEKVYKEALDQAGLEPYAQGHLDDVKLKPDMIFKLTVPLQPIVNLDTYRDVRLPVPEASVPDEDVDKEVERLRRQRAIWKPADRPSKMGDGVVVTFKGTVGGQDLFSAESESFELTESTGPLPLFAATIVGMSEGEKREFSLDFPDDWPVKQYAGKSCRFHVTMELVREQELPEVNDDLARLVGEYDTLEQLREKVRERLLAQARSAGQAKYADEALDKVVEGSHIEYPPTIIEHEMDDLVDSTARELERQSQNLDAFLSLSNQTRDQFRESLRSRAERNIKRALVLGEIAEKERLTVSAEEIERDLTDLHAAYRRGGLSTGSLDTPEAVRRVSLNLISQKAIERVVAVAKGEAPELPSSEAEAAAPGAGSESGAGGAVAAGAVVDAHEAASETGGSDVRGGEPDEDN